MKAQRMLDKAKLIEIIGVMLCFVLYFISFFCFFFLFPIQLKDCVGALSAVIPYNKISNYEMGPNYKGLLYDLP